MSVFAMQWEEGMVIENYLIKLNKILFQSQVYKFIFFQDHPHVSQECICACINFGIYIHTHCLNRERKMKPKSDQDYLRGKLSHATKKYPFNSCYVSCVPRVHNTHWKLLMLYQLSPNITYHISLASIQNYKFNAITRHSKRQHVKSEITVRKELLSEFNSNILNRKQYLQPVKQSL